MSVYRGVAEETTSVATKLLDQATNNLASAMDHLPRKERIELLSGIAQGLATLSISQAILDLSATIERGQRG